jgi:trk system potassium uptake protein TrkA
MRVVIVGASDLAVETARILLDEGHEVIVIEQNSERIEALDDELACSFLHGDGSDPHIMDEVAPQDVDILFCLTDNDQVNILTSLIGKSRGCHRAVTLIVDSSYLPICGELGLEDVIVPDRTVGRYLADLAVGRDVMELSTMVKGVARFFSFIVEEEAGQRVKDLDLPARSRAVYYYRGEEFELADPDTKLEKGDELIIVTDAEGLTALRERWQPQATVGGTEPE